MKKFYLIRLAYDDGFYSHESDDFRGYLNATKYEQNPMSNFYVDADLQRQANEDFYKAATKKPIVVVECWENE